MKNRKKYAVKANYNTNGLSLEEIIINQIIVLKSNNIMINHKYEQN